MKYDINNVEPKFRRRLLSLREDKTIIPKNKKSILAFDEYLGTMALTKDRRYKYLTLLSWFSRVLNKPFEKATKKDIMKIVSDVEKSNYAEWTKSDRKIIIKRFYKWLKGNDEYFPEEVRWIKCKVKNRLIKMPEDLITEEEVKKMADVALIPRDKAFIQVLYESGCRIAELLTLQLKNISFDEYGAILRVTGKTGDRRIRIVASVPALAAWVDFHPFKDDPESYLWIRNLHKGAKEPLTMRYPSAKKLITQLAQKAGISKRVNPHAFRHARATVLANKLTEAQMKEYFGWVQGSDMASVYVHLSGRDIDNAILGIYNMKEEKKESEKFRPVTCARCSSTNSPGSKFCTKCGYALTADVAIQMEDSNRKNDVMEKLMKDPEFKELVLKKLKE